MAEFSMKKSTLEWIEFAEGDWATANRERNVKTSPNYRAVCFHGQQCGEKYLKAYIQEKGNDPKKTHDLENLLDEILTYEPNWESLRESCAVLTDFAVLHRYPGMETTELDAGDAIFHSSLIRKTVREFFSL